MMPGSELIAEIWTFYDSFHLYRDESDVSIKVNLSVEYN